MSKSTQKIITSFTLLFCFLLAQHVGVHAAGLSSIALVRTTFNLNHNCSFNGTIRIGAPNTLSTQGRFYGIARQVLLAFQMVVDKVNQECGLRVGNLNYKVELLAIDDESSPTQVQEAAELLVNISDFLLGPISSGLTGPVASVAEQAQKLLIAGVSAQASIFAANRYAYGTLPSSSTYLYQALHAVRRKGGRTVVFWHTDGNPLCNGAIDLATSVGLSVVGYELFPAMPSVADLNPAVERAKVNGTDAVVLCPYLDTCLVAFEAMRQLNWNPKALVVPICAQDRNFLQRVGSDARYIIGLSPWVSSVVSTDSLLGWTSQSFHKAFYKRAAYNPTYHAASGGAALSLLLQSIQRAGSVDTEAAITEILRGGFETFYGNVSFTENGLYVSDTVAFQVAEDDKLFVVGPPSKASGDILYPMPTWAWRDCVLGNNCSLQGQCQQDGMCICDPGYSPFRDECIVVPLENMQREPVIQAICYVIGMISLGASMSCLLWTIVCRHHGVVKASQMKFLLMIALGGVVSSLSIFCSSFDDKLDSQKLARIGQYIPGNMACMGTIWTYTIGFTVTFAPLFAKMWRVRALIRNTKMLRVTITNWQVLRIVTVLTAIDATIMTLWQLDAPWKLYRESISVDERGFPLQSAVVCRSETGRSSTPYLTSLFSFHLLILAFGTRLCCQTAGIPTALSEGKYVSVAIVSHLQLLALGIPLLILVVDDPPSNMLVRAGIVFLNDLSALGLIFLPKLYLWAQNRHEFDTAALLSRAANTSNAQPATNRAVSQGRPSNTTKVSAVSFAPTEESSSVRVIN